MTLLVGLNPLNVINAWKDTAAQLKLSRLGFKFGSEQSIIFISANVTLINRQRSDTDVAIHSSRYEPTRKWRISTRAQSVRGQGTRACTIGEILTAAELSRGT